MLVKHDETNQQKSLNYCLKFFLCLQIRICRIIYSVLYYVMQLNSLPHAVENACAFIKIKLVECYA